MTTQSSSSGGADAGRVTPSQLTAVVHLVRHGEVANPQGILYGRLPGFRLSEDGQVMAKAAADFMAGRDGAVLRSSPLERAVQTADPIAEQVGLPFAVADRLTQPSHHFKRLNAGLAHGSPR